MDEIHREDAYVHGHRLRRQSYFDTEGADMEILRR